MDNVCRLGFMHMFLYFAFCIVFGFTGRFSFFFFLFSFSLQWSQGYVCIFSFILTDTRKVIGTLYSRCLFDEGRKLFLGVLLVVLLALIFLLFCYMHTYIYQGRTVLINLGYHFNASFLQQKNFTC